MPKHAEGAVRLGTRIGDKALLVDGFCHLHAPLRRHAELRCGQLRHLHGVQWQWPPAGLRLFEHVDLSSAEIGSGFLQVRMIEVSVAYRQTDVPSMLRC